jgi:hypothetical protein
LLNLREAEYCVFGLRPENACEYFPVAFGKTSLTPVPEIHTSNLLEGEAAPYDQFTASAVEVIGPGADQ